MRTLATGFAAALILSFLALSITSHADRPATFAFGPDTDRDRETLREGDGTRSPRMTPPPETGTSDRPDTGVSDRPDTGISDRPDTGISDRPGRGIREDSGDTPDEPFMERNRDRFDKSE